MKAHQFHIYPIQRFLALVAVMALAQFASAQNLATNWVAFNDYVPGPGTAPNVTVYNLRGVAGQPPEPTEGPLTNFFTGSELTAYFIATATGSPDFFGAIQYPNAGTPAYDLFNGIVDLGNNNSAIGIRSSANTTTTLIFTNLDPTKRYVFRGTAVRGNNYVRRWTLCALLDAEAFTDAHSVAVYTGNNFPSGTMMSGEAAFNSGENRADGAVVGWDEISPGPDGSFSVHCRQYTDNPLPNGETPDLGTYGYGLCGFMLAEVDTSGVQEPVGITNQPPASLTVNQAFPFSLTVIAKGTGPLFYQWFKDNAPIPNAISRTYAVASAGVSDVGDYYVVVSNSFSSAASSIARVTVVPDTTPPTPVVAVGDCDPFIVTVSFNEPIDPATVDTFSVTVHPVNDPGANLAVNLATVVDGTNLVLQTSSPRDVGVNYAVTMSGIQDRFGNPVPDNTTVAVVTQLCIQEELNGYVGTQDTELRFAAADAPQGDRADFINVDLDDGGGPGHGLIRFDDIFGDGPGQIPPGATILSATLTLSSTAANANGGLVYVYRMLVDWDEATATWNSFGTGVSADGTEAETNAVASYTPSFTVPFVVTVGVKRSVQEWANGTPNYGWVILPTGTDGYRIDTSEHPTVTNRPLLKVTYILEQGPIQITQQPQASQTVDEGQTVVLSVIVSGPRPQFQWIKDGSLLPGATNASLTIAPARPSHAGVYSVAVVNDFPSLEQSQNAQVNVIADLTAPTLVAALAGPNGDTVTLAFSEPLGPNSVTDPSHYSIELPDGSGILSILSATLINGTNVVLSTSPQQANTNYIVRVSGVRDTSQAGNTIAPNSQRTVAVDVNLIPIDAAWKYDATGTDLGTIWYAASLDDADWTEGPALLGLEPSGTPVPILTPLSLTSAGGVQIVTYYFRKHFAFPYTTAGVELVVHQAIDDGAVYYLNGAEIHRFNMPTNPVIYYTNQGSAALEVGTINLQGPIFIPANRLVSGPNLLAIEVHQTGAASSDVVFGLKLDARVVSFASSSGAAPPPMIGNGSGGVPAPVINGTTFSLSFTSLGGRTYTLQGNADLSNPNGWIDVASASGNGGQVSLQDTAATGPRRFYRIKVQ